MCGLCLPEVCKDAICALMRPTNDRKATCASTCTADEQLNVYSQIAIIRQSLVAAIDVCGLFAGTSGDFLPPSPPAEKATARQDQAGKASTGDGRGHRRWVEQGCLDERADVSLRRTGVTRER